MSDRVLNTPLILEYHNDLEKHKEEQRAVMWYFNDLDDKI